MTTFQRAQLVKSLQKLDYDMRLRHYPATFDEPQADYTNDERAEMQMGGRSLDEYESDMFSQPSTGPL